MLVYKLAFIFLPKKKGDISDRKKELEECIGKRGALPLKDIVFFVFFFCWLFETMRMNL